MWLCMIWIINHCEIWYLIRACWIKYVYNKYMEQIKQDIRDSEKLKILKVLGVLQMHGFQMYWKSFKCADKGPNPPGSKLPGNLTSSTVTKVLGLDILNINKFDKLQLTKNFICFELVKNLSHGIVAYWRELHLHLGEVVNDLIEINKYINPLSTLEVNKSVIIIINGKMHLFWGQLI